MGLKMSPDYLGLLLSMNYCASLYQKKYPCVEVDYASFIVCFEMCHVLNGCVKFCQIAVCVIVLGTK